MHGMSLSDRTIETDRLLLVPCQKEHAAALNRMNRLPEVMKYMGGHTETLEDTLAFVERVTARWAEHGCSWWTAFEKTSNECVGAATLQYLPGDAKGRLEVGWRLLPSQQGKGFATEAGQAAVDYGRRNFPGEEIVAVAHPENTPSHHVMERLGMSYAGVEEHYGEPCAVYAFQSD
ncbi:GNAT family N-acetyltransferase [Denitrobaculum tricleocarpae]|uniref:GNAT family N-acetyltransferase n=2 Tax=Denitrobaculum tricleocarpae TaxID=2591009 RepID=A0A545TYC2_9PROT|nr:GNAT family N-acetyltransferase [Denitrobaculum tricleocarpae]